MTDGVDHRDDPIREARLHCAQITRQRARNFYYGLKLLPQPKRDAMYVVYAWMRRADDCADDQIEGNSNPSIERRRAAIDRFQRLTERVFAGEQTDSLNLMTALRWVVESFRLSPEPFRDMIAGQRFDLDGGSIESLDELVTYCRCVGSSVGRVSIDVWGYHHDDAPELADQRGIAFQMTNIIRDFAEDFDNGRVYLPAVEFRRFGITPDDLRHWRKPRECEAMLSEQVSRARTYYDRAARLEELIAPDCRAASLALVGIYERLLGKLERNLRDAATGHRVSLGSISKLMIAIQAKRSARRGPIHTNAPAVSTWRGG